MPRCQLCLILVVLSLSPPARATMLILDTQAAKAVLSALNTSALSSAEAHAIAELPGNQGLIRKALSYKIAVSTNAFSEALLAAAHGSALDTPTARYLHFDRIKPKTTMLEALIRTIETHPADFNTWVIDRIDAFSPPKSTVKVSGYLVVGGTSGGFAFDDPDFFLNLDQFDEFAPARLLLAHEFYHAVQAAHPVGPANPPPRPHTTAGGRGPDHMVCEHLSDLFDNLYQEGSASYVGDPLLLDAAGGQVAATTRAEFETGLKHLGAHRTLLELAVVALQAPDPVPYDDIYALGFYVPEPLYKLGYVMAKALAQDQGPGALAAFLGQPGYAFVQQYARLPQYGKDRDHPALGPKTLQAIQRLASGC